MTPMLLALGLSLLPQAQAASLPEVPGGSWSVQRTVQLDAPPALVMSYLVDLHSWTDWSNWGSRRDKTAHYKFQGRPGEIGHQVAFDGKYVGKGRMVFTGFEGDQGATYDIFYSPITHAFKGGFVLEETVTGGTELTWWNHGKLSFPLRIWYKTIERMVDKDLRKGLARLERRVEKAALAQAPAAATEAPVLVEL